MPGRQSHGRPLLPTTGGGGRNKSKGGAGGAQPHRKSRNAFQSKALDAFAIAEAEVPESRPKGIRTRDLEEEPERNSKRHRGDEDDFDEDDDEDMDEDEAGPPRKKKAKKDDEFEGFSGSEDSEDFHIGVNDDDEDSEIDSDEAFGESDEERFDGYAFSGSNKKKGGTREDDEEDFEDDESLGSDAIDLATALDQFEEDESGDEGSGSGEEDDSDDESGESESESDDDDPSKLDALQNVVSAFGGGDSDDEDNAPQGSKPKSKLSLSDLGLDVKDPTIKKSLKLMKKEERAKSGSSKKLAVPLAKRQQDTLLRSAAYEKTSETLEKWIDTVKHNRRADHLIFPLAQNAHDKGLDNGELQPITHKTTTTDLEQTIMTIMEESGLGPSAKAEKEQPTGPNGEKLSQAELQEINRQRRRERELHSREQARAKRIKKIKSKAYRRIHRKELAKEQQAEHDALVEAGEIDSDDEREALDRRRALERVGARHRESKWAKLGKKAGRAVWDDNFRSGLTEIAQRKEELRRRIEGRTKGSDDEGDSDSDDSEGGGYDKKRLMAELEELEAYDDEEPTSNLMKMAFMQRGEAQKKKENDDLIKQLRADFGSDEEAEDSADEAVDIGRKQFGMGPGAALKLPGSSSKKANAKKTADASEPVVFRDSVPNLRTAASPERETARSAPGAAGAWSRGGVAEVPSGVAEAKPSAPGAAGAWSKKEDGAEPRKSRKAPRGRVEELDLTNNVLLASKPKSKTSKPVQSNGVVATEADDSDDSDAIHLPMAIRDQELIKRAFASEDVVGEFEREKAEIEKEDDEKEIDNTLPGWGSWVGEGVSKRDQARHKGRFVTKVEGIKQKDRKDYKLKSVIINEKRIKKNDQFLASQLPHPFESQQQYERSLRIPVGPEWTTKETFQEATKPRVIIKQGIIAPMSKPMS
ncbi:Utp14 domain containing protein [Naviculisporaceae sp. PSN 640]